MVNGLVTDSHDFKPDIDGFGKPYNNKCIKCGLPREAHLIFKEPAVMTQVKDGGSEQTQFSTGAKREIPPGKGRWDLLPWNIIWNLAKHFEAGSLKYVARNWEQGLPLSTFINSGMDHKVQSWYGAVDEDHVTADIWNAVCYAWTLNQIQAGLLPCNLDDRPLGHEIKGHRGCAGKLDNN